MEQFPLGNKIEKPPKEPHDISSAMEVLKEGQETIPTKEAILTDIQSYSEAARDITKEMDALKPDLPDLPEETSIEIPEDFKELEKILQLKLKKLNKITSSGYRFRIKDRIRHSRDFITQKIEEPVAEHSKWFSDFQSICADVGSQKKLLEEALTLHRECQELGKKYRESVAKKFSVTEDVLQDKINKLWGENFDKRNILKRNPLKLGELLGLKKKSRELNTYLSTLSSIGNLFSNKNHPTEYALSMRRSFQNDVDWPYKHLIGRIGTALRIKIDELKTLEKDAEENKKELVSSAVEIDQMREKFFEKYILPGISHLSDEQKNKIAAEYRSRGEVHLGWYGPEINKISRLMYEGGQKIDQSFKSMAILLKHGDSVLNAYVTIQREIPSVLKTNPLEYHLENTLRDARDRPQALAVTEIARLKVFMESRTYQEASSLEKDFFLENAKGLISERISQGKVIQVLPLVEKLLNEPDERSAQALIDIASRHYGGIKLDDEAIPLCFRLFKESSQEVEKNILSGMLLKMSNNIMEYTESIIDLLPSNNKGFCLLGRRLMLALADKNMPIPATLWERMEGYLEKVIADISDVGEYKILKPIISEVVNETEAGKRYQANKAMMKAIYDHLGKANSILENGLEFVKDKSGSEKFIEGYRVSLSENEPDLIDRDKFLESFKKGVEITQSYSGIENGVRNFLDQDLFLKLYKYPNFEKIITQLRDRLNKFSGKDMEDLIKFSIAKFLFEIMFKIEDKLTENNFAMLTDQILGFYEKILEKGEIPNEQKNFYTAKSWNILQNSPHSADLLMIFPEHAPLLLKEETKGILEVACSNFNILIQDKEDITFLNRLVGKFGGAAPQIIGDYLYCLKEGAITLSEKDLVEEFLGKFRVLSPAIIEGYRDAKSSHTEEVFIAGLEGVADMATGYGKPTETQRKSAYYRDVLKAVYQNNSGQWTTFEKNESCMDRSADLMGLTIKDRYEIDLLAAGDVKLKEGVELDRSGLAGLEQSVVRISEEFKQADYDPEVVKKKVSDRIEEVFVLLAESEVLNGINIETLTIEQKLFIVLSEAIYGTSPIEVSEIKTLLFEYEFANFEDIRDYIQGTNDRVVAAQNRDYALLCEFHNLFADRIKEINRRLVQDGWKNEDLAKKMSEYFTELSKRRSNAARIEKINKLQLGKLGLSDTFVKQMRRVLNKKAGVNYTEEEVREIITRYERRTGLAGTTSTKGRTKEFSGQLRGQKERTRKALELLDGKTIDPAEFRLGEMNFDEYVAAEESITGGTYNDEQFASYTVQQFIGLFNEEREFVEGELGKFISSSGKSRTRLNGYISKSAETAHARMVGGVCVSGDNPNKGEKNMWNMPNYLQLVLQDPETKRCQGLVLLHHFEEAGKKILTASFNPSSTYLYGVDEKALFKGLSKTLEEFASVNGFDRIEISKNKTIRTNRTGAEFEREMDRQVAAVGITDSFVEPRQFSFTPNYQLKDMDVIWERR